MADPRRYLRPIRFISGNHDTELCTRFVGAPEELDSDVARATVVLNCAVHLSTANRAMLIVRTCHDVDRG